MKFALGIIALIMGAAILLWVGYNLFIERQPQAEGMNPLPGVIVSLAFLFVGIAWVRGRQAGP
jgi:hypothetical protein